MTDQEQSAEAAPTALTPSPSAEAATSDSAATTQTAAPEESAAVAPKNPTTSGPADASAGAQEPSVATTAPSSGHEAFLKRMRELAAAGEEEVIAGVQLSLKELKAFLGWIESKL